MKFNALHICIAVFFFSSVAVAQNIKLVDSAYAAFYQKKDYASAAFLFDKLVKENPYHHDYIVRLAFSNYYQQNHLESINQFRHAIDVGSWPSIYSYFIAANYLKLDRRDKAIHWLNKSIYEYNWPDYGRLKRSKLFSELADTEDYKAIFGLDLLTSDRSGQWKNDLHFVYKKLQLLHFNLYNRNKKETWDKLLDETIASIPIKDDKQLIVDMMKFAALAGEGHTKVLPPEDGPNAFRAIPIELYHFKDGTYVVKAKAQYKHLVGAKIIKIGAKDVDVLSEMAYVYRGHENMMHHKKMSPRYLVMAETLRDMNAISDLDAIEIEFVENNKTKREILQTYTLGALDEISWVYPLQKEPTPLYLKNKEQDFWFEAISDSGTFYMKINYIVDTDKRSFQQFTSQAFTSLDSLQFKNLIIDLRNCGGGNSNNNKYLLEEILKRPHINSEGHLFVLIGRQTYSAAMNLVSDLEYRTKANFVGEPTGSSPNFIGESNVLNLPNSDLYLVISDRYHQGGANNSSDKRPWISPNTLIELSSFDYFNQVDPALNYILGLFN